MKGILPLANFPPELLGQILSRKHSSYLLIPLWRCGNRSLNEKLALGVDYVDLKDTRLTSTSRYPMLLSQLRHLRYLSLNRGTWFLLSSSRDLSEELQKLNGGQLATLRIISGEARDALVLHDADKRERLGLPSRFFDLHSHFPLLTTLHIDGGVWTKSDISESDLIGLPPTLTKLKAPHLRIEDPTISLFSRLPRSLLIWKTTISNISMSTSTAFSAEFWRDPPPFIHTIRLIIDNAPESLEALPPTLTSAYLSLNHAAWSLSLMQSLPPLMDQLRPRAIELSDMPSTIDFREWKVPNQITSLSMAHGAGSLPIPARLIPTLPSSLLSLSQNTSTSRSFDWNDLKNEFEKAVNAGTKFWPQKMNDLQLGNDPMPPSIVAMLPSTLTSLSIGWGEEIFAVDCLPTGLTALLLELSSISRIYIKASMPQSLRTLLIQSQNRLIIDHRSFASLPSSLEEIFIMPTVSPIYTSFEHLELPKNLKSFSTSGGTAEWFEKLPSGLQTLESFNFELPPHQSLDTVVEQFKYLPSSITKLRISLKEDTKIIVKSDCFFEHLVELKELHVSNCDFNPRILAKLPSTLEMVEIKLEKVDESFAAFFERCTSLRHVYTWLPDNEPREILAKFWPLDAMAPFSETSKIPIWKERLEEAERVALLCPHPSILQQ